MATKYLVTSKSVDNSNGNIVAAMNIFDDGAPQVTIQRTTSNDNMSDEYLSNYAADQWSRWINAQVSAAAITDGVELDAVPSTPDPKQQALFLAQVALQKATTIAQAKTYNDPDVSKALTDLAAAEAAVAQAAVVTP